MYAAYSSLLSRVPGLETGRVVEIRIIEGIGMRGVRVRDHCRDLFTDLACSLPRLDATEWWSKTLDDCRVISAEFESNAIRHGGDTVAAMVLVTDTSELRLCLTAPSHFDPEKRQFLRVGWRRAGRRTTADDYAGVEKGLRTLHQGLRMIRHLPDRALLVGGWIIVAFRYPKGYRGEAAWCDLGVFEAPFPSMANFA